MDNATLGMKIKLWQITPVAAPDDPRWQGSRRYRKVVVAAESPALARVIASKEIGGPEKTGVGNESENNHSKFIDEKLYRVDPMDGAEAENFPATAGKGAGLVWHA